MNDLKSYVVRDVVYIDYRDLDTDILQVDQVIFNGKYGSNFDFGRLAYPERSFSNGHYKNGVIPVVLASKDNKRLDFLGRVLDKGRMLSSGNQNVFFTYVSLFFSYVDRENIPVNFECFDSVVEAYKNFVVILKHRTQIKTNVAQHYLKPIVPRYAQSVKKLLEEAIAAGFDVPVKAVSSLCPIIIKETSASRAGRRREKAITKDSLKRHARACENFINVVHSFLDNKLELPLEFGVYGDKSYLHGIENSPLYSQDFKSYLVTQNHILEKSDIEEYGDIFVSSSSKTSPLPEHAYKQYLHDVNKSINNDTFKKLLANQAITIAAHLFGILTRSNQSVVLDCKIHTLKFDPTTKGYRTSGLKSRAGNRPVFPEFGARFVPTMKKILYIREWILDGAKSEWMWCILPTRKNQKKPLIVKKSLFIKKRQKDKKSITDSPEYHNENGIRGRMNHLYPDIKWVNSRNARNASSVIINDLANGDTEKSSTMMSNTEAVYIKHYNDKALDDVATEMEVFLTKLHNSAVKRTRNKDSISVSIVGKDEGEAIPSGSCMELLNPERIDDFTVEVPEPDCQKFENCLFCKHFAIHTDETDIRKLLSLQYLIKSIRGVGADIQGYIDRWGIIIHRIDEILNIICERDKLANQLVEKVRAEVNEGELLDDFWSVHLNTLVDVGVVL